MVMKRTQRKHETKKLEKASENQHTSKDFFYTLHKLTKIKTKISASIVRGLKKMMEFV
jgi:hypothetical protein